MPWRRGWPRRRPKRTKTTIFDKYTSFVVFCHQSVQYTFVRILFGGALKKRKPLFTFPLSEIRFQAENDKLINMIPSMPIMVSILIVMCFCKREITSISKRGLFFF